MANLPPKEHLLHDGEVVLDYIVKDWHNEPNHHNRQCYELPAQCFDLAESGLPFTVSFSTDGLSWGDAFFTDEEISELMHGSEMSCPEDDKDLLDKAHQSISGPLWSSVNSSGEDENLPTELVEHLEFCEDYEDSLHLERVKNAEVNLHRYLAVQHRFRENPSEPKNESVMDWGYLGNEEDNWLPCHYGTLLCKDRITCDVTILNPFPIDRRGYALGVSDYGKVFITEKFRRYIPEQGGTMKATVSLSDVELHNGRPKMCQLNLIYIH